MINKIIVTEKFLKTLEEDDTLELGDKGDFILLKNKGRKNYRFGKLEKLVEDRLKHLYIEFSKGESYNLSPKSVFGVNVPDFTKVHTNLPKYDQGSYFRLNLVEEIVVGKENIVDYLSEYEKYKPHAEAIRRLK